MVICVYLFQYDHCPSVCNLQSKMADNENFSHYLNKVNRKTF